MSRFASAKHLASWAGVGPGNKHAWREKVQRQNHPRQPLPARSAGGSGLGDCPYEKQLPGHAQFHRLARRLGKKKAVIAVAHSVLVIIYHVLRTKKPYTDLGADYFEKLDMTRIRQHHVQRLEQLGYRVTMTPNGVA